MRRLVLTSVAVLGVPCVALCQDSTITPPPQRKAVTVRVLDSLTGAPISSFRIAVGAGPVSKAGVPDMTHLTEPWKTVFTNRRGEVVITDLPRGYLMLEAQCAPARDTVGPKLDYIGFEPGTGIDTTVEFRVRLSACAEYIRLGAEEAARQKDDVKRAKAEAAARAVAGNWRGVLRDKRTGQAVKLAPMRIDARGGIGFSDSTGHFWLWGFAPGKHKLFVHCPTRRQMLGRAAATVSFVARPAMNDTADVRVAMDGCEDVPVDTVRVRAQGVYTTGFEAGFFRPCKPFTEIRMGGYRDFGYASLEFADDVIEPPGGWPKVPGHDGNVETFVDLEGDLIGPGSYGHMGIATFVLRVTRVFAARAPSKKPCGR